MPAEELLLLKQGGDYGWPECYYDPFQRKLVLAPEYGGDGGKKVGVCANKIAPVADFPAHWAPNGAVFYDQKQFPAHYRNGVFIAFHGSWDRAPYPQAGYNVIFQPVAAGRSAGPCELFADGFAGPVETPEKAIHRPSGVAVGPDGSLYISDDITGRIYKLSTSAARQGVALNSLPVPARLLRLARSQKPRPSRRKAPTRTQALLFLPVLRRRWWPWVIASITVKWAEPPARAAMAQALRALPWLPI